MLWAAKNVGLFYLRLFEFLCYLGSLTILREEFKDFSWKLLFF
jgi:hypothetical protein